MKRRIVKLLVVIGGLSVVAAIFGIVAACLMLRHGFSARDQPSGLEALMAQTMRALSIPSSAKRKSNPVKPTAESLMAARAHFADHCAQCHGNDGAGQTEMGRNLYPKPPDMRGRITQDKSDGELFYIIQNGIRLTGMPAWGEAGHDDAESWQLVAFIRQLPRLTAEDLAAMEYLNPKSPEEWKEMQEESSFLNGGAAPTQTSPKHGGH